MRRLSFRATLCVLTGCMGLVACEREGRPPPSPPERRAPTPQEIAQEVDAGLRPLYEFVAHATRQTPAPAELGAALKTHLQEAQQKHGSTQVGKDGLRQVVRNLEDGLKRAREVQNGSLVLLICDLIRVIEPNNSRVARHVEWATIEKNRPAVVIRGWYEPHDAPEPVVYVFVEVFLPETNEVHNLRVREGETFLGLKFHKIVGNKRGMLLEYLATRDLFEVYSRRWLERQ